MTTDMILLALIGGVAGGFIEVALTGFLYYRTMVAGDDSEK